MRALRHLVALRCHSESGLNSDASICMCVLSSLAVACVTLASLSSRTLRAPANSVFFVERSLVQLLTLCSEPDPDP